MNLGHFGFLGLSDLWVSEMDCDPIDPLRPQGREAAQLIRQMMQQLIVFDQYRAVAVVRCPNRHQNCIPDLEDVVLHGNEACHFVQRVQIHRWIFPELVWSGEIREFNSPHLTVISTHARVAILQSVDIRETHQITVI